jgi:hypothetical protein
MPDQDSSRPTVSPPSSTRGQRFLASWFWFILKNVLGSTLILLAFVAGPLVPGPGGIPLFLIGFALISFPGKRRLTARVLRGKPVRFNGGPFVLISLGIAVALAAVALAVARSRWRWVARQYASGPFRAAALYLIVVATIWLVARVTPNVLNILLRLSARIRRKIRPWLRRHHIHLLPPRWRRRLGHEPGIGPLRLPEEILKLRWRHKSPR